MACPSDRQTPATEGKMPDCDVIIQGVRTKLQSLAEKGAAAPSAEKAAWEKRVLGAVKKIDDRCYRDSRSG
jgi:hypothetical protein